MLPRTLRTSRLLLRPFSPEDGPTVLAYWRSDPNWARFNESVPDDFDEQDAARFVLGMIARDPAQAPNWVLVHEEQVVGVVSLVFDPDLQGAVLGFGIHAALRGRGLTAEAARAVLHAGFANEAALAEVRAYTDPANVPSMRVLAKLGFTQVERPAEGTVFRLSRVQASSTA